MAGKGRKEPRKLLTESPFRRGLRDSVLGSAAEYADLGPDNDPSPPDYFMPLNARQWGSRQIPDDWRRQLKSLDGGQRLRLFWHRPSLKWLVCEKVRNGAGACTDLFKTLFRTPHLDGPTLNRVRSMRG